MNSTNQFDETRADTGVDKVDLYEEELSAEKHLRDAGEVRLNKRIVTTEKTITVPVMHEEITVERVPYERPAQAPLDAAASSFDEVRVPLCEEEVAAEKFTRALGEVRLHKRIVTTTKTITVPVMHEEIQVEHVTTDRKRLDYNETMFKESSQVIPLHDEEVEIRKYAVPREGVSVRKTALQEERTATTQLRREELDIERPKMNGATWRKEGIAATPREFVETSQVIPLYEEEIEIRKYPVLREEVRVSRAALQEEQTASAETMKEELDIEEPAELKRYRHV